MKGGDGGSDFPPVGIWPLVHSDSGSEKDGDEVIPQTPLAWS